MALYYSEYEDRYGSTFNGLPPWLKVKSYLDSYDYERETHGEVRRGS